MQSHEMFMSVFSLIDSRSNPCYNFFRKSWIVTGSAGLTNSI